MTIQDRLNRGLFLMDGAMGTQIHERNPPPEAWGAYADCPEWLCHSAPEIIRDIHMSYFRAGSDAVETNTFGASAITLEEFGLASSSKRLSREAAHIARTAADRVAAEDGIPRFVWGSIGPGSKLPTLGQVGFQELRDAYVVQMEGVLEGGADGLLIETCQDLLQVKAALVAAEMVLSNFQQSPRPGLYVSVTVEKSGAMLTGSSIGAVVASLLPFSVDILGLNCATGPDGMVSHLEYLSRHWPRLIACMPNAGLPELRNDKVFYPLNPTGFADVFAPIVRDVGIHVAGGCCGTSPAHIAALKAALAGYAPCAVEDRLTSTPEQASSIFSPMDLDQSPPPLYIGERANATGSKKFRDLLLAENLDAAFQVLSDQEEAGAHLLDLSVAYAGRDERNDMNELVSRAARECRLPLMIDTTQLDVMEAALQRYGGRMVINSVNFEDGEERAAQIVRLARRYGAALVGLTIDESGMAMTAPRKVDVAKRLIEFCVSHGLNEADLMIDVLTFTVGSGDDGLRTAALEIESAIHQIKRAWPAVRTVLGLSNISFGLKPAARKVLNSVFLNRAVRAGLDACIVNTAGILPMTDIPDTAQAAANRLLDNDWTTANIDPLEAYIQFFEDEGSHLQAAASQQAETLTPEQMVLNALLKGRANWLDEAIPELLKTHSAEDILDNNLIAGMQEVGRLFNDGILQLPFVLKSAEVMRRAVDMLKPHMKKGSTGGRGTIVLATVAGDVHDIGKNLVDIILSNNGYTVINLGVKIPVEDMIAAVKKYNPDVLGMSGLLVKSVQIMKENLRAMNAAGIHIPVALGGAALTPDYVAQECQPVYAGVVRYCRDAFDNLELMRELQSPAGAKRAGD